MKIFMKILINLKINIYENIIFMKILITINS